MLQMPAKLLLVSSAAAFAQKQVREGIRKVEVRAAPPGVHWCFPRVPHPSSSPQPAYPESCAPQQSWGSWAPCTDSLRPTWSRLTPSYYAWPCKCFAPLRYSVATIRDYFWARYSWMCGIPCLPCQSVKDLRRGTFRPPSVCSVSPTVCQAVLGTRV